VVEKTISTILNTQNR